MILFVPFGASFSGLARAKAQLSLPTYSVPGDVNGGKACSTAGDEPHGVRSKSSFVNARSVRFGHDTLLRTFARSGAATILRQVQTADSKVDPMRSDSRGARAFITLEDALTLSSLVRERTGLASSALTLRA